MSKQPEALRLASFCDGNIIYSDAANELRRQHALIQEMRALLIRADSWISDVMVDEFGWPLDRVNDPPSGSHLHAIRAALTKSEPQP